jgi:hypothetical protein
VVVGVELAQQLDLLNQRNLDEWIWDKFWEMICVMKKSPRSFLTYAV